MGRMLDALKRAENVHVEAEEQRFATPLADVSAEAKSVCADGEEIPFIEVGPRRSMEASASVLACSPASVQPPYSPLPRTRGRGGEGETPPPHPLPLSPVLGGEGSNMAHAGLRSTASWQEQPLPLLGVPTARSVQFRAVPNRVETRSRFAAELVAYHAPEQPAARQYRAVLDAVLNASAASERSTALLFLSSRPQSGNTITLLNVAITAARQGRRRVVVVDANLRQPSVADRLGLPAAPGLREVLAGTAALDEVVQATEQANLFALSAGVRENSGTRFASETMRSLLRQLRQNFPLVFVDGPCWDGRPEGIVLAGACDAVFLVVHEQEVETPQIDALIQHIPNQGARLAGCILVADSSPLT